MAPKIAWVPTLVDSQNIQALRRSSESSTKLSKLHYLKPQQKPGQLNLILIDSSASTGNQQSLGHAKAVVSGLSQQSYLNRHELAIIEFGNNQVTTRLHPQRAPKDIEPTLARIKLGGGTPLRKALLHAKELLHKNRKQTPHKMLTLYVLTDGRTNDDLSGLSSAFSAIGARVSVIDTEQQAIRLGRCHSIAAQLNADYQHVDGIPVAPMQRSLITGAS